MFYLSPLVPLSTLVDRGKAGGEVMGRTEGVAGQGCPAYEEWTRGRDEFPRLWGTKGYRTMQGSGQPEV